MGSQCSFSKTGVECWWWGAKRTSPAAKLYPHPTLERTPCVQHCILFYSFPCTVSKNGTCTQRLFLQHLHLSPS